MWFLAAQMYCSLDCEGGTSNWFPLKTLSLMVSIFAEYKEGQNLERERDRDGRERCNESVRKSISPSSQLL